MLPHITGSHFSSLSDVITLMAMHSNPSWYENITCFTQCWDRNWRGFFIICILSQGLSWSNVCNKVYLHFCLTILNSSMHLYLSANHLCVLLKSWSPLNFKLSKLPKLKTGLNEIPGSKYLMRLGKGWTAKDRMGWKWVWVTKLKYSWHICELFSLWPSEHHRPSS